MLKLLLVSLGLTAITVLIHGLSTLYYILFLAKNWKKKRYSQNNLGVEILLMELVGFLLVLHLTEAGLWAGFYFAGRLVPTFETAMYYSLTSYTTVGYGDVILSGSWRLMGPIEASVGVLMMGWSTGVIVTVILRAYTSRLKLFSTGQEKP
ncbi:MAG: potassium channel family protein [Anaerohalosphaeraceae bacterium]